MWDLRSLVLGVTNVDVANNIYLLFSGYDTKIYHFRCHIIDQIWIRLTKTSEVTKIKKLHLKLTFF